MLYVVVTTFYQSFKAKWLCWQFCQLVNNIVIVIVVIQRRHVILLVNRHAHLEVMIIPFCSISKSPISTFRLFPRDKNPKNNTISEAKVEKTITFVLLLLLFLTMLLEIVKYFWNSLSDIEKLALHPTFSTYFWKYSFLPQRGGFIRKCWNRKPKIWFTEKETEWAIIFTIRDLKSVGLLVDPATQHSRLLLLTHTWVTLETRLCDRI